MVPSHSLSYRALWLICGVWSNSPARAAYITSRHTYALDKVTARTFALSTQTLNMDLPSLPNAAPSPADARILRPGLKAIVLSVSTFKRANLLDERNKCRKFVKRSLPIRQLHLSIRQAREVDIRTDCATDGTFAEDCCLAADKEFRMPITREIACRALEHWNNEHGLWNGNWEERDMIGVEEPNAIGGR